MDSLMTPEDRIALVEKISTKLNDLEDADLKSLAKEMGLEQAALTEDMDKTASKALADSIMDQPAVVDTDVLTGDRGGLKNFLIKKSRDKESQS